MTLPLFAHSPLSRSLEMLFREALNRKAFSGASLLVGTPENILFQNTWGNTHFGGSPVNDQTRFDLASLTKPLVTAALYMSAVSRGKIELEAPLSRFFPPALLPQEKRNITLRHILNHCAGFVPYEPFYRELIAVPPPRRSAVLLSRILETPLLAPPAREAHYSDLGFLLLGMILEDVLESRLDDLASRWLNLADGSRRMHHGGRDIQINDELGYFPLKVCNDPTVLPKRLHSSTQANAPSRAPDFSRSSSSGRNDEKIALSFAATEYCPWRNRLLVGEVHDENAFALGGVAGHAGLFGTARGVFRLISFLWNIYRGTIKDAGYSARVVKDFWSRQNFASESTWALGFDTPSKVHSSAGDHFSPKSVGHLGFTGTSLWMDLEKEIVVILLTNRVHPTRQNEKLKEFRTILHNLIMEKLNVISRF